jgi:murein DD-endopeptidase MepM/ murein hydrolase activator NlpD
MAEKSMHARRTMLHRALGALLAMAMITVASTVATANPTETKKELDQAKAELEQLKKDIAAQQEVLNGLNAEAAKIAQRFEVAWGRYEQATADLRNTENQLHQAQDDYQAIQGQLDERAREAYITGPGNELEFVLGASSFTELSERMEYVNALSQEDVDLATRVQNLKNDLAAQRADQMKLQDERAAALAVVQKLQDEVNAKLDQAKAIYDDLSAKQARAEELVKKLGKKYQHEIAQLTGLNFFPNNLFQVCPIGQPRALYDGFGAPRYAGGYHPHAGNDIISVTGVPEYAVFDGYATASYNTLGGNSVHLEGALGYAYYAHMVSPGYTGPVHAGDVIGYVGATGDTSTPHLHFEWHPNQTPTNWPASPYGLSVISGYDNPAVNPYPLLAPICT